MSYPLPVYHFMVEWGGSRLAFSEVSGLEIEAPPIEYRDGLSPEFSPQKMPGLKKYGNVVLKRGIVQGDGEFFEWFKTIQSNTVERRDVTISLLNEEHEPVLVWKVIRAWPCKISSPDLKATGNEVAIESLELCHEGLTIENP